MNRIRRSFPVRRHRLDRSRPGQGSRPVAARPKKPVRISWMQGLPGFPEPFEPYLTALSVFPDEDEADQYLADHAL